MKEKTNKEKGNTECINQHILQLAREILREILREIDTLILTQIEMSDGSVIAILVFLARLLTLVKSNKMRKIAAKSYPHSSDKESSRLTCRVKFETSILMKYFICILVAVSSTLFAEEELDFKKLLEERIEANKELDEEYFDEEDPEEIKKASKVSSDSWELMLKHIQNSKDVKLQYITLKSEYYFEISNMLYSVHYDKGIEKENAKESIVKLKSRLELIEKLYKESQKKE